MLLQWPQSFNASCREGSEAEVVNDPIMSLASLDVRITTVVAFSTERASRRYHLLQLYYIIYGKYLAMTAEQLIGIIRVYDDLGENNSARHRSETSLKCLILN